MVKYLTEHITVLEPRNPETENFRHFQYVV